VSNSRVPSTISAVGQLVFTRGQTSGTELLYDENHPLDGQTSQVKSTSQLVNLPYCPAFNETTGQEEGIRN